MRSCARSSRTTRTRRSRSVRRRGSTAARAIRRSPAGRSATSSPTTPRPGHRRSSCAQRSLVPPGQTAPLTISGYQWSPDKSKLLIFTNTKKVWRQNTRGDYWLLDRASGALKKLGGNGPEASLMFAKFSPDGTRVAYVRAQNVYVEDLASGRDHAADDRRRWRHHQRHVRLGERGGVQHPGRLPLEPRRPVDRLLAVQHDGRRAVHARQRHRRALSEGHADPLSEAGHHELRRAGRRRPGHRRPHGLGENARRASRLLHPAHGLGRRAHARRPAHEPAAEPQRRPVRRCRHRRSASLASRRVEGVGRGDGRGGLPRPATRNSSGYQRRTDGATPTRSRATAAASGS